MYKRIIIVLMVAGLVLVTGCAKKKAEEVVKPDESVVIMEEQPIEEEGTLEIVEEEPINELLPVEEPVLAQEFKVQLFATYDETKANQVVNDLRGKFTHEVYVEYIAPYYKVRLGHFTTKADAEMARDMAREKGYADAFVVVP